MAVTALIALVLALSVACGGDDDDDGAANGNADTEASATATEGSGSTATSCPEAPYAVALRAANGDEAAIDEEGFEITSAKAVRLSEGAGYTVYMADFEIDEGAISGFSAPTPPADGTLVTLFLTTFNATGEPEVIEGGTSIEYTPDFGVLTFRVVIDKGGELYNSYVAAQGTVTVDEAGDSICGEVTYTDSASDDVADVQNKLEGTFSAPVVKDLF